MGSGSSRIISTKEARIVLGVARAQDIKLSFQRIADPETHLVDLGRFRRHVLAAFPRMVLSPSLAYTVSIDSLASKGLCLQTHTYSCKSATL